MELILTRKQQLRIGRDITIRWRRCSGGQISLSTEAPDDVIVLREELIERDEKDAERERQRSK
jgi:carbon storage regulator CsrA